MTELCEHAGTKHHHHTTTASITIGSNADIACAVGDLVPCPAVVVLPTKPCGKARPPRRNRDLPVPHPEHTWVAGVYLPVGDTGYLARCPGYDAPKETPVTDPLPPCDYCTEHGHDHRVPGSKPMSVLVAQDRDSDGQPTHLYVSYSAGEHVGEGEAEYVRRALRAYGAPQRRIPDPRDRRIELLSQALGEILVAAGVAEQRPLTGPELLLLANDYTEHLRRTTVTRTETAWEPDEGFITGTIEIPADHPMAEDLRTVLSDPPLDLSWWLVRCTTCKHPRASHDTEGTGACTESNVRYLVAPSNRDLLSCHCTAYVQPAPAPEPEPVVDDMPWSDAARDFGDAPLDDDTGQPTQPAGELSDTWEATVTLTRRLLDGSPFTVTTASAEDRDPHRAVAQAWLNTDAAS